ALAQVDQSSQGWTVKTYQNLWFQPELNANYWADEQLQGYHGPNYSDQSQAQNGEFTWPLSGIAGGALDFYSGPSGGGTPLGGAGDVGFMTAGNGLGYDNGFYNFGIPGPSSTNYDGTDTGANIAMEFNAYVYFPTSGIYQSFFNSDDGFRVTLGG